MIMADIPPDLQSARPSPSFLTSSCWICGAVSPAEVPELKGGDSGNPREMAVDNYGSSLRQRTLPPCLAGMLDVRRLYGLCEEDSWSAGQPSIGHPSRVAGMGLLQAC